VSDERAPPLPLPPGVLVVRSGHGANCSSIGSVVDLLFGVGVVGGVLVVGLTAWLEGQDDRAPKAAGEGGERPAAGGGEAGRREGGAKGEGEAVRREGDAGRVGGADEREGDAGEA
jgi:hypothetical protein